ncbi:hypothetical protein ACTXOR_01105 [Arthrobacter rhombi]|uniref:hypothetical protein n=1 Tax=Arthrobacter rhombi TaxID=71253 RepID=UPI003FD2C935
MSEDGGAPTADTTGPRQQTGASWISSNRPASMYAAVMMLISGGVVWSMAGAPEEAAKNWLILAWILLTSTFTAFALAPRPVPRVVNFALAGVVVAVVVWAWSPGVQESSLATPFIPLAIGAVSMAFSGGRFWPEAADPEGASQQHD